SSGTALPGKLPATLAVIIGEESPREFRIKKAAHYDFSALRTLYYGGELKNVQ
ncbi:hypothetical protein AVEN_152731-1, partial [Araneus ventricosus]